MEFTPFERKTIEAIDDCKGLVRNCSWQAVAHLEKAWKIREIDKEMTVIRGVAAEEQAAMAIFFCLKNNQYNYSDKILFK